MKEKNEDKEFRRLIKNNLPEAPRNPWFTRKVLNRLPPRRNPAALVEKWVFLLCFAGAITGLVIESVHVLGEPIILVRDLMMLLIYFFIFLVMALWLFIPLARGH